MNKSKTSLVPIVPSTNSTNSTNGFRFTLEKGSKKYHCPNCGKKRLVAYIDTDTGTHIPQQYGRCDRESKCGYHLNPYKDGYNKKLREDNRTDWKPQRPKPKNKPLKKPVFFPFEVFSRTREGYDKNTFIQNLLSCVAFPFEVQDIEKVISLYHLGTVQNGYQSGSTTFPFIDINGNVRAIQVKQFDKANHTTSTDFLHSIIEKYHVRNNKPLPEWLKAYNKNETKASCLFGEHLLRKYPYNPIALVEAPKTALYGSLYFGFPEDLNSLLWLAVYNLSSLNLKKCKSLKGRSVYLFPDLSKDGKAFRLWSDRSKQIQKELPNTFFRVSDLLEQLAPDQDKEEGKDIADFLIDMDWRLFRKPRSSQPQAVETPSSEKGEALETSFYSQIESLPDVDVFNDIDRSNKWNLKDLENFFAKINLPAQPLKFNSCSTIANISLFVESHLSTVNANNGKRTFLPYLNRLQNLKKILKTTSI